jgi:TonB-linked SusC/RagA family outer membrane protein
MKKSFTFFNCSPTWLLPICYGVLLSPVVQAGHKIISPAPALVPDVTWQNPQRIEIRGIVRGVDGPLAGVTVAEKGKSNAVATGADGSFHLQVSGKDVTLVFSSVGYKTLQTGLAGRTFLNIDLEPAVQELSNVVVTALGIKREKKSLGYSVGELEGKEFSRVAQENILNAIAGKVPGVSVSATGGTGSSVYMVIRGAKSLSTDNQPLFVVDGVPIANTVNNVSQVGDDNRVDYGNAISDINPEDIESMSILKGPSAAALYGSRAGNGVVIITTKSGSRAKRMQVTVTSNTVFDIPYKFLKWQKGFGTGQFSAIPVDVSGNPLTNPFGALIIEAAGTGFGAALDKGYKEVQWNSPLDEDGKPIPMELVSHPDNVKNFVQTGITTTNGVSMANSNEQISYRMSYSNMTNRGIIPNSDLFRNTLSQSSSFKVSNKLRISSNLDFSRNNSNNRPAGNRGTNPLQWAYNVSPHTDIRDLRDYWLPGQEGLQQRTQSQGVYNNPYFLAYEVNNSYTRDRVFGNVKADLQLTPEISLLARYSLDTYKETRETKIANSYTEDPRGAYGNINLSTYERNIDFMATYKKDIHDFSLVVSAGANSRYQKGTSFTNATKIGTGLIVPGVFNVQNIAPANLDYSSYWSQKGVYSALGLVNVGYKGMVYVDATFRNDWSSTLPPKNRSYNYYSYSLSLLLNEMFHLSPDVSMLKLRGGVAQVGNDANPYMLLSTLGNAGAWDGIPRLTTSGNLLSPDLKPELATSYETGIDANFFKNRLRFAGTYYYAKNRNQIFSVKLPPSSGYTSKNINAGLLESKGIELSLGGTPVQTANWTWDINVNLSRNRTRIVELSDELPYFTLWEDAKGGAWTYVGDQIGDIYDAKLVTVTDEKSPYFGYPLLDQTGKWQSIDAINTKNKIGNFNPDFMLGGQTTLSYKGFSLSMTFDWRHGGDFVSQTYRYGEEDGHSQLFLDKLINPGGREGEELRDWLVANQDQYIKVHGNYFPIVGGPSPDYGTIPFKYGPYTLPYGGVIIPGVIAKYDNAGNITGYTENLGGPDTQTLPYALATAWSFTRAFTYDASYLKLREISFTYDLPERITRSLKMQHLGISVYSRNIMLWTKAKIGIDPETAFQTESGLQKSGIQFKQGIERYNVTPWSIPVGFKLNVTF